LHWIKIYKVSYLYSSNMAYNFYISFLVAFGILFLVLMFTYFGVYRKYRKSSLYNLSKYNARILLILSEDRHKWFSRSELTKKYDKDKIIDSINWLKSKKYISKSESNLMKITDLGIMKIFELRKEDQINAQKSQEFLTNILIALLGIMLAFASFQLQAAQTNLINQQTAIMKETSQSIRPDLTISPYPPIESPYPFINQYKVSDINLDNSTGTAFDFKITNTGKMNSGPVRITLINNWSSGLNLVDFTDIPSGDSKTSYIVLNTRECYWWEIYGNREGQNRTICTSSRINVPKGFYPLELKIDCINCNPEVSYLNISSCFDTSLQNNCSNPVKS